MDKNIEEALRFTHYVELLSNTERLFIFFFILPFIFALIGLGFHEPFFSTLILSFEVVFLPALLFLVIWRFFARQYLFSHGVLLAILGSLIVFTAMAFTLLFEGALVTADTIAIGSALEFVVVLFSAYILVGSWKKALPLTIILISFHLMGLLSYSHISYKTMKLQFLYASLLVLIATAFTLRIINAPLKRRLGYSTLKVLQAFWGDWFYGEDHLEELFEDMGKKIDTSVDVISIFAKDNSSKERVKEKDVDKADAKRKTQKQEARELARILVPYFHFGPFGSIGGSSAPFIFKQAMPNSLILHGTATHELNPTSKKEVKELADRLASFKLKPTYSKMGFAHAQAKDAKATAFVFDGRALTLLSRAPKTTEDIEIAGGKILREKLKRKYKDATIVDCHNSSAKEITFFTPLSEEFHEYEEAVEALLKKNIREKPFKASFASGELTGSGSNRAGFSLLLLSSGSDVYALLSLDVNGILPRSKRAIERLFEKRHVKPFICTTDSHENNIIAGAANEYIHSREDLERISAAIDDALSRLEPASYAFSSQPIHIKVLGEKQVTEIITTINNTWAIAKLVFPAAVAAVLMAFLLLF